MRTLPEEYSAVQTVKHRWLDESAPMKLSPLREALEAGKTLLGDELPALDLEAGPQPDLPAVIPPPQDAAEAAAGHEAALPDLVAAFHQDVAMPDTEPEQAKVPADASIQPAQDNAVMLTALQEAKPDVDMSPCHAAAVPSPEAATQPAEAGPEVPNLAPGFPQQGSAGRRSKVRSPGAKGRGAARGKKRKVNPIASHSGSQLPEQP